MLLLLSGGLAACDLPQTQASAPTQPAAAECSSPSGGPGNNPVMQRYAQAPKSLRSRLDWTDEIRWQCVYNIRDFKGKTDLAKYEAAKQEAIANGGGVIYFPAGTYEFSENINLADGIILRGETPAQTDAKSDGFALTTKFVFPQYKPSIQGNGTPNDTAFKQIQTDSPDSDSNLGLVHVDLNRAGIDLVGDADSSSNRNLVIFGLRSNNVAEPDPKVPHPDYQSPWLRYSYRFAANIRISARENILVANNRINDAITDSFGQANYQLKALKGDRVITHTDPNRVPFDYANHYGIVVNRSKDNGFQYATDATQEPGLFRPGITILDNWVYHTMRVGIHASGQGLLIQGNEVHDNPQKQWWTDPTGTREPRGSVTYENRAIDWSGHDVTIADNQYKVYRHRITDSQYLSVDGEGILIQECCGGSSINGLSIQGNRGNGYIGLYKVPQIKNVRIEANDITGGRESIYVNADTNNAPGSLEDVAIAHNKVSGNLLVQGSQSSQGVTVRKNQFTGSNTGELTTSCGVEPSQNQGFAIMPCIGPK